ncbi:hypothetical protein BDV06DRAFT_203890 [Aspergillus oleicola]
MSLTTITSSVTTTDAAGSRTNVPVLIISGPDTADTPVTTRYLDEHDRTVDIVVSNTTGDYKPTTKTETLPKSKSTSKTTKSGITNLETAKSESSTETTSSRTTESTTTNTLTETTAASTAEVASRPLAAPAAPTNANNSAPAIETAIPNTRDGISNGALAGAIVGSIVATALVVLLLAFLFFRRRREQPPKELELEPVAVLPKGSNTHYDQGKPDAFALASIIPQPADDDTVRTRILAVIDQASLHVDNYYAPGSAPIQLTRDQSELLERYDTGELPAPVETLLGQMGVQRQVITHVLVHTLLKGIMSSGELLPAALANPPQTTGASSPNADTDRALFTWRMLKSHLYHIANVNSKTSQSPATTDLQSTDATISLATDFTQSFAPYGITTSSPPERESHFASLARLTANLGTWLFSQPCAFEFFWGVNGNQNGDAFLVTPGVVKVADENGTRLAKPQVLIEGVERVYQGKT